MAGLFADASSSTCAVTPEEIGSSPPSMAGIAKRNEGLSNYYIYPMPRDQMTLVY